MNFFSVFNYNQCDLVNNLFVEKVMNLFLSFLFSFLLVMVSIGIIIKPLDLYITKVLDYESIIELIHTNGKLLFKYPFYLVIFIGPFVEEVLFRLILNLNKFNMSLFLGLILLKLLTHQLYEYNFYSFKFLCYVIICIIFCTLCNLYLPYKMINLLNLKKRGLIIISILLFGFIHILNIKIIHLQLLLFYPFYVLPQMIIGYFITNLRLKYGFIWGLFLHILINASSFLIR